MFIYKEEKSSVEFVDMTRFNSHALPVRKKLYRWHNVDTPQQ